MSPSKEPINEENSPDYREFYVPLHLAGALADFTHDVTVAMTPCTSTIDKSMLSFTSSLAADNTTTLLVTKITNPTVGISGLVVIVLDS